MIVESPRRERRRPAPRGLNREHVRAGRPQREGRGGTARGAAGAQGGARRSGRSRLPTGEPFLANVIQRAEANAGFQSHLETIKFYFHVSDSQQDPPSPSTNARSAASSGRGAGRRAFPSPRVPRAGEPRRGRARPPSRSARLTRGLPPAFRRSTRPGALTTNQP